ncbi:MFS transporter [soil metagenome]
MTIVDKPLSQSKSVKQHRVANAVFFFISGFGYSTWASRIPTIQHQFHLNDAQLGGVLFAMPVGLMLTMPLSGRLLNSFSSRRIMLIGALILNVVLVLMGLANSIWQLVALLFCFGSARNVLTLSINTLAVGVQSLYNKSIMVTFHGIWSLAGFAGAAVGYIAVYFNIAPGYHFLFASIALLLLTLYFINDALYQQPVPKKTVKFYVLPDKYLLKFSLICFASMACENTMYDWSALYFQKEIHSTKSAATAAFVIYMIAMTAGRFIGDRLVTRAGIKTVLKFSGIFIFSGLLLAVLFPVNYVAIPGFILVGLGVSCIVPMVFALAGRSKNMSSGTALASISTIGYLGFLLVPPFVGFVAHAFSLRLSFGIIALLGASIVFLVSNINAAGEGSQG